MTALANGVNIAELAVLARTGIGDLLGLAEGAGGAELTGLANMVGGPDRGYLDYMSLLN